MLRGLAIVVCSAACLGDPKFKGVVHDSSMDPEGPSDPCAEGVNVTPSGNMNLGATACGPGYQVVFSDTGARMPYQFNVGGSMLMGSGLACNDERGAGVALFPTKLINGLPFAGVTGTLSTPMTGPAVAKVVVNWAADYSCDVNGTLQDRTTYTFFPNGHIVRWDHLRQTETVTNNGACGICAGGNASNMFVLTSYMALIAGDDADLSGASIGDLDNYGDTVNGMQDICLTSLQRRVAFAYRNTATRVRVAVAANPGVNPRVLAFVQDIQANVTTIGPNFADEVTTHMMLSSSGACSDLRADARARADRPGLIVQSVPVGPANDGIYGGENDSGNVALQTVVGDIMLRPQGPPIPGGFAVWIEFGAQPNSNTMVTHSAGAQTDGWVQIQRVSGSQLLYYFRDPLQPGQTITIVPN